MCSKVHEWLPSPSRSTGHDAAPTEPKRGPGSGARPELAVGGFWAPAVGLAVAATFDCALLVVLPGLGLLSAENSDRRFDEQTTCSQAACSSGVSLTCLTISRCDPRGDLSGREDIESGRVLREWPGLGFRFESS